MANKSRWMTDVSLYRHEYKIWHNVNRRAKANNYRISPLFLNFDSWLEWSQQQKGFMLRDISGNIFQSESDLLSFGEKTYSEETVVYVPNSVNQLCKPSSKMSGVQYQEGKAKPFRSYINKFGKPIGLGYSETRHEALRKSMVARVGYIKELKAIYESVTDSRVWEELLSERWCPKYSQI